MIQLSPTTKRRLSYAAGYLALGLCKEAAGELKGVTGPARLSTEFLTVQSDLLMATKQWPQLVAMCEPWAGREPQQVTPWINWAYALREMEHVPEAKEVLLLAERIHPNLDILHYNLACYHCLLGEMSEAKQRLRRAVAIDKNWVEAAAKDPDLAPLH